MVDGNDLDLLISKFLDSCDSRMSDDAEEKIGNSKVHFANEKDHKKHQEEIFDHLRKSRIRKNARDL